MRLPSVLPRGASTAILGAGGGVCAGSDAADGQLGGLLKVYREWRVSGDIEWLRRHWAYLRASMDYCIRTWDPRRRGWIEEPT